MTFRLLALSLLLTATPLTAQVPNLLPHQGRVAVNGLNFDGTGLFKFAIVNAAGTVSYWSNDGSSAAGSQPGAAVSLPVVKGLYSVMLGDTALSGMAAVPVSIFANADLRLRVWFNNGTLGFQQLSPDQRMAPNGYLPDGAVTAAKLAPGMLGAPVAVTGTTQAAAADMSYVTTTAQTTTFTLPAAPASGAQVEISGAGTGGWTVSPAAGQGILPVWSRTGPAAQWFDIAYSSDGQKLVAAGTGDFIYTSANGGVSWTPGGPRASWQSVASSADGVKLAAAATNGRIYTSSDSGTTWTARDSVRQWNGIASSADGTRLVACAWTGMLYTSANSGVTWTAREGTRFWKSVASSSDGTRLAAAVEGGNIFTTVDAGITWTERALTYGWQDVACSADGLRIIAGTSTGQLFLSTNGGAAWLQVNQPGWWNSVCSSADGTRLAAASSQGIIHSADGGATWVKSAPNLSLRCVACTPDGLRLAAGTYAAGNLYTGSVTHAGSTGTTSTLHYSGNGWWTAVTPVDASDKVERGGDTMTGSLTLPPNGLILGSVPLVSSGANLGIGTSTPSALLSLGNTLSDTKLAVFDGGNGYSHGLGASDSQFRFNLASPAHRFSFINLPGSNEILTVEGSGNVGIGTATPGARLDINGNYLRIAGAGNEQAYIGGDGAGGDIEIGSRNTDVMNVGFWNTGRFSHMNVYGLTFTPTSDRHQKENFAEVDPRIMLEKVITLPVTRWNYKADTGTPHIGPMAQDFHAAFGTGADDKHIATVDADGVTLAAIKGLNAKLESALQAKEAELETMRTRQASMEQRLAALEAMIHSRQPATAEANR